MRHLENKVGMNPATDRQTDRQTYLLIVCLNKVGRSKTNLKSWG